MERPDVPSLYSMQAVLANSRVRQLDIGVTMIQLGGALSTLTFFSDVAERMQAHQELQRASSNRQTILHNASAELLLSMDRHNQWVNDKFSEMLVKAVRS